MVNRILFSLEKCVKCTQTKELLSDRDDVKIVTYPHSIDDWDQDQLKQAKEHDIYNDLQTTAPILWANGEKIIGYLRIRKWLQENKFE